MRFLFFIVLLCIVMVVPVSVIHAQVTVVKDPETVNATNTQTLTVTIPPLPTVERSVEERIAELFASMGGDDTLTVLGREFTQLAGSVMEIIETKPIDFVELADLAEDISYLALRLRVYMLQQQTLELTRTTQASENNTYLDIIFGNN